MFSNLFSRLGKLRLRKNKKKQQGAVNELENKTTGSMHQADRCYFSCFISVMNHERHRNVIRNPRLWLVCPFLFLDRHRAKWNKFIQLTTSFLLFFFTRSSGCRIITRRSSVSDAGGKRREIVVPGKAKPKDKEKEKALKGKPHVSLSSRGKKSIQVLSFPEANIVS